MSDVKEPRTAQRLKVSYQTYCRAGKFHDERQLDNGWIATIPEVKTGFVLYIVFSSGNRAVIGDRGRVG